MMQTMQSSSMSEANKSDPDSKVLTDLNALSEQIELCSGMLKAKNGIVHSSDEALLAVVGFLEACAPRMVELVEAAAQGALVESTLIKCLEINDRLLKVLSDCDNEEGDSSDSAAAGAGAGTGTAAAKSPLDLDLDDLLLDDTSSGDYKTSSKVVASAPTGPLKSDPFGGTTDLLVPTPLSTSIMNHDPFADSKPPAAAANNASAIDDEFDAFLRDRTDKTD